VQRFILRQNIARFHSLLQEKHDEDQTHFLIVMLAQARRELAVLESLNR